MLNEREITDNAKQDNSKRNAIYQSFIKRFLDIFLSLVALIGLFPVFLIIFVIVKLDSKGPVIYKQKRVGQKSSDFFVYKYRTMVANADQIGPTSTKEGDKRITRAGKLLRKTSLDELPQLINVLLGTMSIVGYRPGVRENYTEEELNSRIFDFKPGITGYAQVYGRSTLSRTEKRHLELRYCNDCSFVTDIKVILKTVQKVIRRDGTN